MAKSKSARVSQQSRNTKRRTTTRLKESVYGGGVPNSLYEAIEHERGTLSKAESILRCLAISLEYGLPSTPGPYYPDVAEIAYKLVAQALNGLDSLYLSNCVMRDRDMTKDAQDQPQREFLPTTPVTPKTAR
jgi:hypothetical protein